ncbi:MAG: hypothetical protein J6C52_01970 [Clostridia bacterium]|nr:hypothetical protein [Clostridia bacterium]
MKRTATLLILTALLANLAACGGAPAETPAGDTTAASGETTTAAETDPPLEVKDFGGHVVKIMTRDDSATSIAWNTVDVYAAEENGEAINDAVYRRNVKVEDTYNVKIERHAVKLADHVNTVKNNVMAGDDTYDLILTLVTHSATLSGEGVLNELNALPYLDFTKDCWDSSAMADFAIGGKNYYCMGEVNITDNDATWSTLFNKDLKAKYTAIPDLYELVKSGKWTMDALREYGKMATVDLDSDSVMNWEKDQFGLIDQYEAAVAIFSGAGLRTISVDDKANFTYELDSETNVNALGRIWEFFSDKTFQLNADDHSVTDKWNVLSRGTFKSGRGLFFMVPLSSIRLIRDMEYDFGILPVPKLDEKQAEYCSTIQYNNATAYSIPVTAADPARTALILEALCEGSVDTLTPAYYDITLKRKASRDDASSDMLDLIFAKRCLDPSFAFTSIGTWDHIKNVAKAESNNVVSLEAANHDTFLANAEKIFTTLKELD